MLVHEIYLTLIFAIFRIFDKDNDGFLTTDELRKIMKGRMSKRDLELMIKEADSDNDGFINCKGIQISHTKALKKVVPNVLRLYCIVF